jgi:opacity protein-like surface antigen
MKKSVIVILLLAACVAAPAQEQTASTASTATWIAGFDFRGALPMGDFKDLVSFGAGGTAYAGYAFSPMFAVTARTGYIFTGGKDVAVEESGYTGTATTNYGIVPLLGGLRVSFLEGDTHLYVAGEAGMYVLNGTYEVTNSLGGAVTSSSKSESKFGYAPAIGAQFRAGMNMMVDAHVDYTGITDTGDNTISWVSFGVGLEWTLN